jgi:anti-sigma28 factor (negative regulator of flagellin synthesis)
MRIEPTEKSIGIGPASPAQPDASATPSTPARADRVQLSVLSQAAAGLAPGRIEEIQADVKAGTYKVDAGEVSRRIVNFYSIPAD